MNTNENPYPPTPTISNYLKNVDPGILNLYPDPTSEELRQTIGDYFELPPSMVFIGNGSDEVLSFCFYAFFDETDGPVLFPEHSYSFYPVYCGYYELPFLRIPFKENFSISVDSYITAKKYSGIIIANPNAPTGTYLKPSEIRLLLERTDSNKVVIIDEAYIDFGGESSAVLIKEFDNLLVVQTLSKSRSLAGLRAGFALGNEKLISALTTVKDSVNSYPLDRLAQNIARLAIEDTEHFKINASNIIETREVTTQALKFAGWEVLPSLANFIFIRKKDISGLEIYEKLKENGLLVRYFGHQGIEDFARVTIGQKKDMIIFLELLKTIWSN